MMKRILCLIFFCIFSASCAYAVEDGNKTPSFSISPAFITLEKLKIDFALHSSGDPNGEKLMMISQSDTEDLSHSSISSSVQKKDLYYYVEAGGDIPIYDKRFRDFIDYGGSVSLGIAKRIASDLTLTASVGMVVMTGKWSAKGDRQSLQAAASESWTPGIISQPGQVTVNPEDVPQNNLGQGYSAGGEAVITSSENLNTVDIETTMYLFPVKVGAVYCFPEINKVNPYVGGGVGFCIADRETDSHALKEKYFDGPEYGIKINKSQTVTGMLIDLVAGVDIPFRTNMKLFAEVGTSLYNLKNFDPILEVSDQKTSTAPYSGYSDITTYSYENPEKIGVFRYEFISSISFGFIMQF